jgi:peptidoglycan/LPS O-acetylase OafA/YrhL
MASEQFGRAFFAGLGILGLAAVMVATPFINEADAEPRAMASSTAALLVISSNTHLVLKDRHIADVQPATDTMVCSSVIATPIVSIGLNCDRL